ncbi:hypothetical protein AB1K32_08410 [Metabacillus dongyingensis]|uniref:hypothetical protein n=1 Tax=Metabacillus dongyingensis TaxID=2874282 RepID=UPI003B8DC27D
MKIGYTRVSTVGQDLASQEEILKENGCERINSRNTNGLSVKDIVKLTSVPKATLYVEIRKKRATA